MYLMLYWLEHGSIYQVIGDRGRGAEPHSDHQKCGKIKLCKACFMYT